MSDPKGLDSAAVAAWLARQSPDAVAGPFEATLVTGGKSNLTYFVTDGVHDYVVRRPPLGHVLATAHDMAREHRVMAALAPTDVPVPRMIALCEDTEVLGAPFYVMERVSGTPYARASQLEELGEQRTREITGRMVDTLVALHAVDHREVGLAEFGRPDGYVGRQVSRWKKQLAASTSRELPGMDELVAYLDANVPESGDGTIVHGDFRLDNLLVDDADQVTAVLDWEMSTLGDPLSDVALLLAYQQLGEVAPVEGGAVVTDAPRAPGYLGHDEVVERYAAGSGRDVGDIGFHLSLAFFKLAVILEGIHFRHSQGQTVGTGFDGIGDMIAPLIDAGRAASR
ncbi:phosphotransferase [Aeromicrobium sp. SMF47]|uniref:Phosphotransferase n=1 Tax=Aeromicrobium yanjiei TaxID=2662028 RepID=A0A5Q2MI99_9ACTN|nr:MULTISPECIES: phosphotransferase family protein [Aeromicrobium]MRJ78155.1 phosphotransferase [Aeromicrobium yanjiei]MRK03213.1 phosphotransferase [Aeromicrobium sp. S22]QGG40776.1 phosphotransferase [Aeromicrobium yanjiei]